MKIRKTKKGISLIVLVITIIVMIILAAAIVITLSNSGIINKANEAVDTTNLKQVQQIASVIWSESYMNANGKITEQQLYDEVIAGLTAAKIDTTKYKIEVTLKRGKCCIKSSS